MTVPTAVEAEWIRDHALTKAIRRDLVPMCSCQYGPSGHCDMGQHDKCAHTRLTYPPDPETYIVNRLDQVLHVPDVFTHPLASITGRRPHREAQVWLADRACRWQCPCTCHTTPVAPVDKLGQLTLFEALP